MKETKSKANLKVFLVIICVIVITLGVVIAIINNNIAKKETYEKILNESVSEELVIIRNFDYEKKENNKYVDNGYIIYKSGLLRQFNKRNSTINDIRTIPEKDIYEISQLISKIDESQKDSVVTCYAIMHGVEIIVVNQEGKKIHIKDAYSTNYSEASKKLMNIFYQMNILDHGDVH